MTLNETQIQTIKEQLFQQTEGFPEDQKTSAREYISGLNAEQLEQFLIQNNLLKPENFEEPEENSSQSLPVSPQEQKCIFCSIVEGKIPTFKIIENEDVFVTLELNPISKGHSLVIPKRHITKNSDLPENVFIFVKEFANALQKKLNSKKITVFANNIMGHEVINLLPIYENETPESPRKKATEDELKLLQKELTTIDSPTQVQEKEPPKPEPKEDYSKWWLPKRMP